MSTAMEIPDPDRADSLVPPRRLATLLVGRRESAGHSLIDLAALDGTVTADDLARIEAGEASLSDDEVRRVANLYGLDLGPMSASRAHLQIDRSEGTVALGDRSARFSPGDDDRQVMLRYLALVYRVRQTEPGTVLPARAGDLSVLADVFGTSPEQVRSALDDLMAHAVSDLVERHRSFRRRVIVPAVGALVAVTALGALLLSASPAPTIPVHIGTALVIERGPSTVKGASIGEAVTIESGATSSRHDPHTPNIGPNVGPNIGDAVTLTR